MAKVTKTTDQPPALGIEAPAAGQAAAKPAEPQTEAAKARQSCRPVCPEHGVAMTAYATSAMFTYYRCPRKPCRETTKQIRPVGPLKNLYGHGKSASGPKS